MVCKEHILQQMKMYSECIEYDMYNKIVPNVDKTISIKFKFHDNIFGNDGSRCIVSYIFWRSISRYVNRNEVIVVLVF